MAKAKTNESSIDSIHNHGLYVPSRLIVLSGGEDGEIGYESYVKFFNNIHILHQLSPVDSISIVMNTPGGSVDQGLAMYDLIKSLSNPVFMTVFGRCYSMGSIILQAADHRTMAPNAAMMIHRGSAVYEGDIANIEQWRSHEINVEQVTDLILLEKIQKVNSKMTLKKLRRAMMTDTILTAEQALHLNLIDEILPTTQVASAT